MMRIFAAIGILGVVFTPLDPTATVGAIEAQPAPRIVVGRNGEGEVIFERSNCVVYYDRDGRRTRSGDRCTNSEIRRADDGMQRYRREQGLTTRNQPGNEYSNAGNSNSGGYVPEVVMQRAGTGYVKFSNSSCHVYYDTEGRRTTNTRCEQWQLSRADRAMASHRREQGMSSYNRPGSSTVYRNIDAKSNGNGDANMSGIKGNGNFRVLRARVGTGGDVIIDTAEPTSGEIRGTVRSHRGNTVVVDVSTVYGYDADGTISVILRSGDSEIESISGSGGGERGRWSITFRRY